MKSSFPLPGNVLTAAIRRSNIVGVLLFGVGFTCLAGAVYLCAIAVAGPLLAVHSKPARADIIVVLGGDGPSRAARAAALFRLHLAPKVLVSGDGDCTFVARRMIELGVDPAAVSLECQSGSTAENALFSAPILTAMNVQRAIIVTSWFHSRRAVQTFEAALPSVEWLSLPTDPPASVGRIALSKQGLQIVKEYPKSVVYALRRLLGEQAGEHAARSAAR